MIGLPPRLEERLRREARAWRRSRIVAERRDFRRRERTRESGAHRYTLAAGPGRTVLVRHDTLDSFVLEECFGGRESYRFPERIAAALDRSAAPRIIDVGANVGMFGLLALDRWPRSSVTGYEPEPANADLHAACIAANDLAERWRLVRAFAAVEAGSVRFTPGGSAMARAAAEGEEAIEVPAVDLLAELGPADLLKLDIEGAEWPLLADPRLASAPIGAAVVELHGRGCPADDPLAAGRELLERAGFEIVALTVDPLGRPLAGRGVVWALRPQGAGRR